MKDISLGVAEVNSEFPPLNSNGAARSGRASIFVKELAVLFLGQVGEARGEVAVRVERPL
jgi:hypothetical protein